MGFLVFLGKNHKSKCVTKERGLNLEERRQLSRVNYGAQSVIVICETGEKFFVKTENVSPLGMGIHMDADAPNILGKDIIIVAETLIMYADVIRQVKNEDGSYIVGIAAKKFTPEVLDYLFEHIGSETEETNETV